MSKKDSFWISYADLMTLLMIVFLLISLSYMALVDKEQEKEQLIISEYQNTKKRLFDELNANFDKDMKKWKIELNKDLSIQFTNPEVLFPSGKSELSNEFKLILSQFFPRYINIILKQKYRTKISEIRIEGHTDDVAIGISNDSYIDNVQLSQDRARNVLAYLRTLPVYKSLKPSNEKVLKYWFTANGLSYGRTLDNNKELTFDSDKEINRTNSRRVEFKILTRSEELIEEIIEQIKEK
jgi:outer membrane protein OmpA-like peptidoglycan-associated protein